jgi:hypothetical protein
VPFPITGVLDSFNAGAFQNLSARSGWSATIFVHTWQTDSTPTLAQVPTASAGNMWATQWQDAECWATASIGAGPTFSLCCRIQDFSQFGRTYYASRFDGFGNVVLLSMVSNAATTIGSASLGGAPPAGSSFGVEATGSTISTYYKASGGSWSQIISVTNTDITATGNIGMIAEGSNSISSDEFGGGQGVVPSSSRSRITVVRQVGSGA